jgi:hypothetical protein
VTQHDLHECLMHALLERNAVFVKLLLDFEAAPYLVCCALTDTDSLTVARSGKQTILAPMKKESDLEDTYRNWSQSRNSKLAILSGMLFSTSMRSKNCCLMIVHYDDGRWS